MATMGPKKTLAIENGPKYAYYYTAAKEHKPTFLILHGFPGSAVDFRYQVADLTVAGYGVLVPDMLGYGGTGKPAAVEEYAPSKMSSHIAKILDHEGLTQVIGVGHDWGAAALARMWNYHPQYFSALVFMSVPYTPPSEFDLAAINAMTKRFFQYETYGYMYFFNQDDAAEIIAPKTESLLSLLYPENSELHQTELCPRGKIMEWLEAGKTSPLPSYESQQDRQERINAFKEGGWTGPTNWYKAVVRNVDKEAQSKIPPENFAITKPVVFMGGSIDFVTRPEVMANLAQQGKEQGWLPHVEYKAVEGGSHWLMLEQPKQVTAILEQVAQSL